jgi:HK97 family phage major capsid protein
METNELFEKAISAVNAAQDAVKNMEGKVDSLVGESVKRATEEAANTFAKIQEENQKQLAAQKALEDDVILLKKKLSRAVAGEASEDGLTEDQKHYQKQILAYLKRKVTPDQKYIDMVCKEMAEKCVLEEENRDIAVKTFLVGSNPDGGYWLMPQRSSTIIDRVFETSPMRSIASVQTTGTDSLEFIIDDNEVGAGGWVGEVSTVSSVATNQFGKLVIPVHELAAIIPASQKAIDDIGFDLESYVVMRGSERFSRQENTAFVAGDGASKPRGFLDYADASDVNTYERGKIGTRTSTTSGAIDAQDYKLLQSDVKEEYQANAVWLMKRATFGNLTTLEDTAGQFIFNTFFLTPSQPMMLLGRPIVFADDMQAIAANAYSVAYGDFRRGYTIVDRFGIRVLRDPFTSKSTGTVEFMLTKRVGGDVTSFDSFKRLKVKA